MLKKKKNINDSPDEEAMYIIDGVCWKCKQQMKVALIRGDFEKRGGSTSGPKTFTSEEIEIASSKGVFMNEQYSGSINDSYLANTCNSCGSFVGEFFLFTDYLHPAEMGDYKYERIELKQTQTI